MADDVAGCILGNILIFKRVFLVISQHNSAVEHDMKVLVVIKNNVSGLLFNHSKLWDQVSEFLVCVACFDQAAK